MTPAHHTREPRWRILLVVLGVIVVVAVAAGANGSTSGPAAPATPTALVSAPNAESSAWYCTGQSTLSGSAAGFLVLTNSLPRPVGATVTTVSDTGAVAHTAVSVPAREATTPNLPVLSSGSWLADTVTVDGGGVAVSQVVDTSSGWDESPCQSTTSSQWFIPSGTTANGASLSLSLLNPTATPVVVDLTFVTPSGAVHPINYQGLVLQGGEVLVENVAAEVQNASTVSTIVTTRTGRVVATEIQGLAAPRSGFSIVPGVAAVEPHWTIPQAEEATDASSEIDIFNPGSVPERVTARLRLASGPLAPLTDTVAPGSTWALATSAQTRIPVGAPYSADVEATGGAGVVVGRIIVLSAAAPAAQGGVALAVDGLSQAPSGQAWVVPPPGANATVAVSGAGPNSLALTNTSSSSEQYRAEAVRAQGPTVLAAGAIAPGNTVVVSGSSLSHVAFDPLVVHASGTMAVSEDVVPSGGVGVVTMPGIPLAGPISL